MCVIMTKRDNFDGGLGALFGTMLSGNLEDALKMKSEEIKKQVHEGNRDMKDVEDIRDKAMELEDRLEKLRANKEVQSPLVDVLTGLVGNLSEAVLSGTEDLVNEEALKKKDDKKAETKAETNEDEDKEFDEILEDMKHTHDTDEDEWEEEDWEEDEDDYYWEEDDWEDEWKEHGESDWVNESCYCDCGCGSSKSDWGLDEDDWDDDLEWEDDFEENSENGWDDDMTDFLEEEGVIEEQEKVTETLEEMLNEVGETTDIEDEFNELFHKVKNSLIKTGRTAKVLERLDKLATSSPTELGMLVIVLQDVVRELDGIKSIEEELNLKTNTLMNTYSVFIVEEYLNELDGEITGYIYNQDDGEGVGEFVRKLYGERPKGKTLIGGDNKLVIPLILYLNSMNVHGEAFYLNGVLTGLIGKEQETKVLLKAKGFLDKDNEKVLDYLMETITQ